MNKFAAVILSLIAVLVLSTSGAHQTFASVAPFNASDFCKDGDTGCVKENKSGRNGSISCPTGQTIATVYVHAGDGQTVYQLPHEGFEVVYSNNNSTATVTATTHQHDLSWLGLTCTTPSTTPSATETPTPTPTTTLCYTTMQMPIWGSIEQGFGITGYTNIQVPVPCTTPTVTDTPTATPTPTDVPRGGQDPTATPTTVQGPTATPTDTPSVGGVNTVNDPQKGVLGAATMAKTGLFEATAMTILGFLGALLIVAGYRSYKKDKTA